MVIFVMTALISSAQVTSESADLYARALKCYENNDKEAARRLLTQVVNMASTNPDVRERAKELLERCQPQAKAAARIDVSEHNLNFAADGDFKEIGLDYTTGGTATNLIGVHKEGVYGRASGDTHAILGMKLFAEYIEGIAVNKIQSA